MLGPTKAGRRGLAEPPRGKIAAVAALLIFGVFAAASARAKDRVIFGLDWKAEAEYGGYYQALATGIYAKHGLDVTIEEGGRKSITCSCWPPAGSTLISAAAGRSNPRRKTSRFWRWRRFFKKTWRC